MLSLENIRSMVDEKVSSFGFELYDIKSINAGSRHILRVYIDKPGGVTIDDCEMVSNELSVLLDVENFSDRPYTLEVSSPGIDRPLLAERDFRRQQGHMVAVYLKEPMEGKTSYTGRVISCQKELLSLELSDGKSICIPMGIIAKGKVQIQFK